MNTELGLMQRFADPALFETMEFSEKVAGGLITTLLGMGVTFTVLVLIWGSIALMARVLKAKPPVKAAPAAATSAPAAAVAPAAAAPQAAAGPGNEVIAAILAAIAASEGADYANRLVVRKISRTAGTGTAWSAAGTADCIESRKF